MHFVIGLFGLAFIAYGYTWSATGGGGPSSFERSLITDIRMGIGLILMALALISYQLGRRP